MRRPDFKMAATTATLVPCHSNRRLSMLSWAAKRLSCRLKEMKIFKDFTYKTNNLDYLKLWYVFNFNIDIPISILFLQFKCKLAYIKAFMKQKSTTLLCPIHKVLDFSKIKSHTIECFWSILTIGKSVSGHACDFLIQFWKKQMISLNVNMLKKFENCTWNYGWRTILQTIIWGMAVNRFVFLFSADLLPLLLCPHSRHWAAWAPSNHPW